MGYGPSENGIKYLTDTYPDIILGKNAAGNYPFKENKFGQRGNECKYCNGRPNGPKDSHPGKISCFVYQWVKIPKETTIHELVEYIREDIIKLLNITYKS